MIEKVLAGVRRVRLWGRCRLLGLHAYDWREVFARANETGELYAECGDCGRKGWPL